MNQTIQDPLLSAVCSQDITQAKGWLADGEISAGSCIATHTVQPPDAIETPALSDHMLAVICNAGDRRVSQFAGQFYDGKNQANAFFLLPAGVPSKHTWYSRSEVILFSVAPHELKRVAVQTECINPDSIELKPLVTGFDEQIASLAHCLLEEIRLGGAGSQLYSQSLFTCFNIHLLRHYCAFEAKLKEYRRGLSRRQKQCALDYIQAHLDQNIQLDDLAKLLDISVYYFCRLFQQSLGTSPYQYVLQQRVERAKYLLHHSDSSILEISLDCGFSKPSHLARHFHKFVGTTPSKYRRQ